MKSRLLLLDMIIIRWKKFGYTIWFINSSFEYQNINHSHDMTPLSCIFFMRRDETFLRVQKKYQVIVIFFFRDIYNMIQLMFNHIIIRKVNNQKSIVGYSYKLGFVFRGIFYFLSLRYLLCKIMKRSLIMFK